MSPDPPREDPSLTRDAVAQAFAQGIGGSRGMFDSSLPTLVFLVVYFVSGQALMPSVWAAIAGAAVVAVVRKVRGEPMQQILAGLVGVGVSAFFAARTGDAADFFLPGLLVTTGYGLAFAVSALIGKPLVGYAAGAITGDLTGWSGDPRARRTAMLATWMWAGMFVLRLAVQWPLYALGWVGALGVAKLVLGAPLYFLTAYLTYRMMAPVLGHRRALDDEESEGAAGGAEVPATDAAERNDAGA